MDLNKIEDSVQQYFQAREDCPKFVKVLDELKDIIKMGRLHLSFWWQINKVVRTEPELIDVAPVFFVLTGLAHINAATLQASKLIETHRDAVHLIYLFNIIENESKKYFLNNWSDVVKSIKADRVDLSNLEDTVERVKFKRDKTIAHLDRTFFNSNTKEEINISAGELGTLFAKVEEILLKYETYYYANTSEKIEDLSGVNISSQSIFPIDFDNIIFLLRKSLDELPLEDANRYIQEVQSGRQAKMKAKKVLDKLKSKSVG